MLSSCQETPVFVPCLPQPFSTHVLNISCFRLPGRLSVHVIEVSIDLSRCQSVASTVVCFCLSESKQSLWVGPKTAASPEGFMFDQDCINTLIEGTDLFGMFRSDITNLQRFDVEHETTPEVWTTGSDYGLYDNAVCSNPRCHILMQCHCSCPSSSFAPLPSDAKCLLMQPDSQQAIKDRRFPTYLAPIKDVTDEVLRDILPVPSDIQHIAEILIQVSNA